MTAPTTSQVTADRLEALAFQYGTQIERDGDTWRMAQPIDGTVYYCDAPVDVAADLLAAWYRQQGFLRPVAVAPVNVDAMRRALAEVGLVIP